MLSPDWPVLNYSILPIFLKESYAIPKKLFGKPSKYQTFSYGNWKPRAAIVVINERINYLTNSMASGTQRFNATFTRVLQ